MAALFEDFPNSSLDSNHPSQILISEVLLAQQFATKASSTEDEHNPEKQMIENDVHQLRMKFEKDVGSLYQENLKRKVLLQFKVFLQLEKLSTHREQLSYQFYYKGMIEKCLSAWKLTSTQIAQESRLVALCFQRLARRGLVKRKAEILKDRLRFKYFIEWQRALFYAYKLKQFKNTQQLKIKNGLLLKLFSSISHRKWAQKTIQRKARINTIWRNFVRWRGQFLQRKNYQDIRDYLRSRPSAIIFLKMPFKILKKYWQMKREQKRKKFIKLQMNKLKRFILGWRKVALQQAIRDGGKALRFMISHKKKVAFTVLLKHALFQRMRRTQKTLIQSCLRGWRCQAKVKLFQKYHRKERLKKVGRKALEGLKLNRNSMKGWRVKMYYLKIMRLASYWMAWKKFRFSQRKYKKILYALFVRKGFRLFKTWRSLVPLLKKERKDDQLVSRFQLGWNFKCFKRVTYQMIRDRYIVLSISRRHYSNLARRSLQSLKLFKDQNIENAAMARIMEERFMEKRASLILRKWAATALGRANKRVALLKVKTFGQKGFKREFFRRLIYRVFEVQQTDNACQFYCSNLKGKALCAFIRRSDLARRGHVVHAGLCNRLKNEFFFLWKLIVQNYKRPLSINTDQSLGRIDSQIVISPQSFQSFSLRHLVVPQWNEYFAEAKAEEWKRQKRLRNCFRQFQLEARNNVLIRLFEAKLMRPIDFANLRACFSQLKQQSENNIDLKNIVRNCFNALRKYKTDEQRFRLIREYYRIKYLRIGLNKLRLLKILREKKQSVLRPVFIQLRIYTLRSLNLKTFLRFRNQEIIHTFFTQWLNLRRTLMQYKQTAANHFKLVLTQKLNKLRRESFQQIKFTSQSAPIFNDFSIGEELMSPEFGNYFSQQRENSSPPSNNEQIPTPPKSPPVDRDINIDLSKVLGSGVPSEPLLLPRSQTMFDFNTNSSGLFNESCRFSRSCHEASDNQLLRRNTPPPIGKQNIYAGYFQVYLAKHQKKSDCPTSRSSILEHSPDIVPSKNFRLCRVGIQSARGEHESLINN